MNTHTLLVSVYIGTTILENCLADQSRTYNQIFHPRYIPSRSAYLCYPKAMYGNDHGSTINISPIPKHLKCWSIVNQARKKICYTILMNFTGITLSKEAGHKGIHREWSIYMKFKGKQMSTMR